MDIGIYNQASGIGINGVECSVAVLAEALATKHRVDIIHHDRRLTSDELLKSYGIEARHAQLRYVEPESDLSGRFLNPIKRYRAAREWCRALSEPYDVFFTFTGFGPPPFCHAKAGILMIICPLYEPPYTAAPCVPRNGARLYTAMKNLYYQWEWKQRMATYRLKTSNSSFIRRLSARRWGVDAEVVYAPADLSSLPSRKEPVILSVGRFTTGGTLKRQLEMMEVYRRIEQNLDERWSYVSIGGLGDWPPDVEYFSRVRQAGQECGAQVVANIPRDELKQWYARAQIFWHAAGYAMDETEHPELTEHFGISTVEAMAAGCVPVVMKKGGQPEIVEHGLSGFTWNTLDELKDYTQHLMSDADLRRRMSEAAQKRAQLFGREEFVNRVVRAGRSAGIDLGV